jgi:hypothetical protein
MFSNAQMAALGSVVFGAVMMLVTRNNRAMVAEPLVEAPDGVAA